VLALMRRGYGRSEGTNGEDDYGREHDGSLMHFSAGVTEAVEDFESAIAYVRKLPGWRRRPGTKPREAERRPSRIAAYP
jgi:hypothetical protein